ncbi:MAG: WecB/TagA/CpsF family glycosyltransferase, partial [Candidatus Dormibacteraceae bacterium]
EAADLAVADGAGVVWALRRLGWPQRERVTGVDLVPELLVQCAAREEKVFLLGAEEGVAAEVGRRLQGSLPALRVVGAEAGSPAPEDDEQMVAMINQKRPDLLLVAYGHPKQELWINRNRHRLQVGEAIGVGGTFDVLAGRVRRAPRWFQRCQLEWLWRLLLEPWRARRMAVLPRFAVAVLREEGK